MKHNAHPLPRFNFLIKFHDSGLIFRPMIGFGNCDPGVLGGKFRELGNEGGGFFCKCNNPQWWKRSIVVIDEARRVQLGGKNRSGIGIRRSRYASFIVLLGLTWVLQSDGDLYPGSFAPLFFHRREISDEIRTNTRFPRTGELVIGEEGVSPMEKSIEKRDTRRFSHGKYTYVYEFLCSRMIRMHANTEVRPLFIFPREKAICIPVVETGFLLSGWKRER